ncbi:uncharacterized protein LOC128548947 isoform X2 [Mercenaria mercenaria]|uniref:uncharacterized protein LOC128548947 isoform X2 n=1 Tax=Mercenaria mercenaria TaxID=6596 RepID=UPI00234F001A|nr:uncharacterized protein LOC128548947 isoform X2 [Mercenaria mercenaria]
MAIKSQYFFITVMLLLKHPFVLGEDCKCEGLVSVLKSTMSREIFDLKMENTMLQARMDKMESMLQEKSSATSSRSLDTAQLERFENRLSSIESNRQHTKKVPTNTLKLHSLIAKALRSEKVKRIQAESDMRKHMQFFNQSISDLKFKVDFVLNSNLTYIVDDIEKVEQKMYDGLDQVENDIKTLQSNISELQSQSNALSDKDISELGLDLAAMNKSVATDIAEIDKRMSDGLLNVKNEIKTMQSKAKKQYQVNVSIDKNVTALETSLSTIDQDVLTMKADIKTLKERSIILLKVNQCPELPSIRNGEISQNTNEGVRNVYGSIAEYTCNIEGCILPTRAANYEGQNIVSPGTTLYNFACDSGYVLSSQNGMTCRDGGSWSQIVTCIKGCTLPNHAANCKDWRTTFSPGEILNNFHCDHGYVLSSQNGMTCRHDGSWSEIVTCIKVQPKECTFDAGRKWHPRWNKIDEQFNHYPGRKQSARECQDDCLNQQKIPLQSVYYNMNYKTCWCLAVSARSYFIAKNDPWKTLVYILSCK